MAAVALICLVAALLGGGGGGKHRAGAPAVLGTSGGGLSNPPSDISTGSTEVTTPTSDAPTPTPSLPSVTAAGIDIADVRQDPRIGPVADLFDRYFTATNAHDPSGLLAIFDPSGVTKSDTPDGMAKWQAEVASTYDDHVALHAIAAFPQVPGGLLVHATFRSQQDPSLGPDGQSCTNWDLVFRLTPYATGYRVLGAQQVQATAC